MSERNPVDRLDSVVRELREVRAEIPGSVGYRRASVDSAISLLLDTRADLRRRCYPAKSIPTGRPNLERILEELEEADAAGDGCEGSGDRPGAQDSCPCRRKTLSEADKPNGLTPGD